jgi:hypothetical protein
LSRRDCEQLDAASLEMVASGGLAPGKVDSYHHGLGFANFYIDHLEESPSVAAGMMG